MFQSKQFSFVVMISSLAAVNSPVSTVGTVALDETLFFWKN